MHTTLSIPLLPPWTPKPHPLPLYPKTQQTAHPPLWPEVVDLEAQARRFVDVTCGPHGARVDVVDGVGVEGVSFLAVQDVREAWGVGEPEDAVSASWLAC
jgi:hypothetical protein